ncbi:MAG: hypothetical protein ACTHVE_01670 [Senegalia sp. (in: firmicutes)]|uniref:hypothetical protein n=1 Tax=Senegalia sp. (in: firmicutes) TaxID=1924098 RepID=UPI003F96CF6D
MDLDIIGLPLKEAFDLIDEDLSINIVETKGTNKRFINELDQLRVIKFDIKDNSIKIIVCAF